MELSPASKQEQPTRCSVEFVVDIAQAFSVYSHRLRCGTVTTKSSIRSNRSEILRTCIGLLSLLLIANACGPSKEFRPPDVTYEVPPDRVYDASKEQVWGGVLAVLVDLGAPINFMDAQSGLVRTGYAEPPIDSKSSVLGCGEIYVTPPNRSTSEWTDPLNLTTASHPLRLTILVREEQAGQTSVRIRERSKTASYENVAYRCRPTGTLSKRFLDAVGDEVGANDANGSE